MATLQIRPLHPSLGAEISGVDLGKPLDASTRGALVRALADHLALVFHDQSLTPEQYLEAASVFGPPMEQHYSQHHMPGFPLRAAYRALPEDERRRLEGLTTLNTLDTDHAGTRAEDREKYGKPRVVAADRGGRPAPLAQQRP